MHRSTLVASALTSLLLLGATSSASADVILENKGLYKKESWNVGKYYDDLGNPNDKPGVITSGQNPRDPSGPAVDFENRPGAKPDRSGSGLRN